MTGRRRGRRTAFIGVVVVLVVIAGLMTAVTATFGSDKKANGGPNVVMIMTDDQTLVSMKAMSLTRTRFRGGTYFANYFASFPLCCPSRATYMSGQYAQNNGVLDNAPPMGGFSAFNSKEDLPVWLQRAGYWTASVGKYLNQWGATNPDPPPGWDHWFGTMGNTAYRYFNYDVSDDGTVKHYGASADEYQTDVLAKEAVATINRRAGQDQPFFLSFTPLAPHAEAAETIKATKAFYFARPAPRHALAYTKEPLPPSPSFDEQDVGDKPANIRELTPLTEDERTQITTAYRKELATLLAADEAVEAIFKALENTHQLENTVVLFTSDNGYFHGEHRIRTGKLLLYEPDVHLPLMAIGGPFTKGGFVSQMSANVDLAPTILALAHAKASLPQDGRDLSAFVHHPDVGQNRAILLENYVNRPAAQLRSQGVRTNYWKYIENQDGSAELYDMVKDTDELKNLADDPADKSLRRLLRASLVQLRSCTGATCNRGLDVAPGEGASGGPKDAGN